VLLEACGGRGGVGVVLSSVDDDVAVVKVGVLSNAAAVKLLADRDGSPPSEDNAPLTGCWRVAGAGGGIGCSGGSEKKSGSVPIGFFLLGPSLAIRSCRCGFPRRKN
jgi:hypothetical protein